MPPVASADPPRLPARLPSSRNNIAIAAALPYGRWSPRAEGFGFSARSSSSFTHASSNITKIDLDGFSHLPLPLELQEHVNCWRKEFSSELQEHVYAGGKFIDGGGTSSFASVSTASQAAMRSEPAIFFHLQQGNRDALRILFQVFFRMKLHELYGEVKDGSAFGPTRAALYTVEFQKRGLPKGCLSREVD